MSASGNVNGNGSGSGSGTSGHVTVIKTVTFLSDGGKIEWLFPCCGGLSISTTPQERCDEEYYTPVGIEIDVSGGLKDPRTGQMLSGLLDPRTGEPFTGVTIQIPADGLPYTERKSAYRQWKGKMLNHRHLFCDVVYLENQNGKTVDTYRWPMKSPNTVSTTSMTNTTNTTNTKMENPNVHGFDVTHAAV